MRWPVEFIGRLRLIASRSNSARSVSDVHEGQTVVGRIDTRFDLNRDLRHCAIRFCGREDSRSN